VLKSNTGGGVGASLTGTIFLPDETVGDFKSKPDRDDCSNGWLG
jgi:hypothetical protein